MLNSMRLMLELITIKMRILGLTCFLLLLSLQMSCNKDPDFGLDDNEIKLRWIKGYDEDSLSKGLLGFEWSLSYIGAAQTKTIYNMVVEETELLFSIDQIGLPENGQQKLRILNHKLKASEEYRVVGAIDMARYESLLIGASEHYYELVDMPDNYSDLLAQYELGDAIGYVDSSLISMRDRIIKFSEQKGLNQLLVAEEVNEMTGELIDFETIDIMPNGQPRFGIFNPDGTRKNFANPMDTEAGKPAKCMWCHESRIQPLFTDQNEFSGFLPFEKLRDTLAYFRVSHVALRDAITTGVDYLETQDHSFAELLYIAFMEPSAERLSLEWNLSIEEVKSRLAGMPTHLHPEFPFIGDLYFRNEIEMFAPYDALPVSTFIREPSIQEVNHID